MFSLQTRIQENIKATIDSLQQEVRSIRLEIRPQFLVPDTNCFIDYLHGITMLLAVKRFTVIIPLIGMFIAVFFTYPCPPIDSILRFMSVWRITGKIIGTAINIIHAHL